MKAPLKTIIVCIFILNAFLVKADPVLEIQSPNQKISFTIQYKNGNEDGLFYAVKYDNQSVVELSKLGISCNGDNWNKQLVLESSPVQSHDTTWTPIYGERDRVRDNYNESVISITREGRKFPVLQLIVRAYDSGIAFRYKFATNENGGPYLHITGESTEFNF